MEIFKSTQSNFVTASSIFLAGVSFRFHVSSLPSYISDTLSRDAGEEESIVTPLLSGSRKLNLHYQDWSDMARLGFYTSEKRKFIVSGSILQPFSQNKKAFGRIWN